MTVVVPRFNLLIACPCSRSFILVPIIYLNCENIGFQFTGTEETKEVETYPGGAENFRRRGKGSKNKKNKQDKKNKKTSFDGRQ